MRPRQDILSSGKILRRAFLQRGALCLAGLGSGALLAAEAGEKPSLRIGLVTDLHYGDKPAAGTRFYRETLGKLAEAVARFNAESPAFVVELGDLIDKAATVEQEIGWLDTIEKVFAGTKAARHYVLGNHCVATLTKEEFAAHTAAARTAHYAFDSGEFHFVILDACFTSAGEPYQRDNFDWKDANIPADQLEWLRADLAATTRTVIIFAHQRLDIHPPHSVRNAAAVREILEQSSKVLAVFQGHSHANDYQQIAGIHYCTLVAMIEGTGLESSGYAMLEVMADGSLRLQGFRRQENRQWAREKA
ncbi:MAG: metallophosphoesterase [Chthoniobacter sp.]|uniref:metallophosphoesterase n=1 Tax=Chthoniobacter sp. TaxID=2510640 RepID=UPI0032AB9AA3